MNYQRDDIYLCMCCLEFKDMETDEVVHVPYSEMPAEMAIELMQRRGYVFNQHQLSNHKGKHRGFRKE